jgi:hypothetical protein
MIGGAVRHRGKPPVPKSIRQCDALDTGDDLDKYWVYAYWGRDGELLYIGISNDPAHRANGHRGGSRWWRFVASGDAWLVDLHKVERLERDMIVDFDPLFNIEHSRGDWQDMVEYCARREAWDLVDEIIDMFWTDPEVIAQQTAYHNSYMESLGLPAGSKWPPTTRRRSSTSAAAPTRPSSRSAASHSKSIES